MTVGIGRSLGGSHMLNTVVTHIYLLNTQAMCWALAQLSPHMITIIQTDIIFLTLQMKKQRLI